MKKQYLLYLLLFVFMVLFSGCSSLGPVPGTPTGTWKKIEEKFQIDSNSVNFLRKQSNKILISGFMVRYVYEIRKGEQSVLSKGWGIEKTRTIKWTNEVYQSLTDSLYDIFVQDLKKRGFGIVDYKTVMSHSMYSQAVGDNPNYEDSKNSFFKLGRCDVRTDTCKDWVTIGAYGLKFVTPLTGQTALKGDTLGRVAYPNGANTELQVEVTVSMHWSEGKAVINNVEIRNKLGLIEMKGFGGKKNYLYSEGTGKITSQGYTGKKYANFPGLWDRLFKDKKVEADHKKFIESTTAAFAEFSDLYSTLIAKRL